MPWKVSGVVEERTRFIRDYERELWTMTELCRHYGIARKTGYKIVAALARVRSGGNEGPEPSAATASEPDSGRD